MSALSIVEDLQVFEQCVGEFEARFPALGVKQFDLQSRPERLDNGIVMAISDCAH